MKKKIRLDSRYTKIALYVFCTAVAILVFNNILNGGANSILNFLAGIIVAVWSILTPIIIGFIIAYILKPIVLFIEERVIKKLFKGSKAFNRRHTLAVVIVFFLAVSIIFVGFAFFIPGAIRESQNIIKAIPNIMRDSGSTVRNIIDNLNVFKSPEFTASALNAVNSFFSAINSWFNGLVMNIINIATTLVTTLAIIIFGAVFGFYFLLEEHRIAKFFRKGLCSTLGPDKSERVILFANDADKIFGGYIIGKIIESLIMAALAFIGFMILGVPYSFLMSVFMGIAYLVPYFGPYIGPLPAILIMIFIQPMSALYVAIFAIGLSALDGWVIGPKLLAQKTGLSPLWVLVSILIGGGLFGLVGLLLGVPVVAFIKLIVERIIKKRLEAKRRREAKTPGDGENKDDDKMSE